MSKNSSSLISPVSVSAFLSAKKPPVVAESDTKTSRPSFPTAAALPGLPQASEESPPASPVHGVDQSFRLGRHYQRTGDRSRALSCYRQALVQNSRSRTWHASPDELSTIEVQQANILAEVGAVHGGLASDECDQPKQQEHLEQAREAYQQCLEIRRKHLAWNHPVLADTLYQFATVSGFLGDIGAVQDITNEVLAMYTSSSVDESKKQALWSDLKVSKAGVSSDLIACSRRRNL